MAMVRSAGDKPHKRCSKDVQVNQAEEIGMQNAHMSALELKHAGLDALIAAENQRPHPDMATLARLKKEKLRVKEAITGL